MQVLSTCYALAQQMHRLTLSALAMRYLCSSYPGRIHSACCPHGKRTNCGHSADGMTLAWVIYCVWHGLPIR